MRKCYATPSVLIMWFLMLPPPVMPPVKDAGGDYKMNTAAPMPQWIKYKTYQTQPECNAVLTQMPSFYKCVASNDPALKKSAPAAAGAPSTATMSGAAASHMQ
jgi:hypothetical protein